MLGIAWYTLVLSGVVHSGSRWVGRVVNSVGRVLDGGVGWVSALMRVPCNRRKN